MCIFFALFGYFGIISLNMDINRLFKEAIVAVSLSILVYFNITNWQNAILGWFVLAFFLLYFGKCFHFFLINNFNLSSAPRIRVLAVFLVFLFLGFVIGGLAWFFQMTSLIIALSFFITGMMGGCLKIIGGYQNERLAEIYDQAKQVWEEAPSAKVGIIIYLILIIVGFYLLTQHKINTAVLSPWQIIGDNYLYVFFLATLILGRLVFSQIKAGVLLFLLILHALLLHAYLPLTHSLIYGADGWRHIASQSSLWLNGSYIAPTLSSLSQNFWQRLDLGTLAYAQFNSLALVFKTLCQIDLLSYARWFMPLVWSVILPILLFEIGRAFHWEKKAALFFVWLSALPFALQVSGSFTLPTNLGLLFWLFALLLMLKNRENKNWQGTVLLLVFGSLSIFGYSLFFVLFWLAYGLLNIFDYTRINKFWSVPIALIAMCFVPLLELISKYSQIDPTLNWWTQIKELLGNFTAWYLAVGPRLSDITTGNIIFNQPPLDAFVQNIFTINRFWLVAFMLGFWLILKFSAYKMWTSKQQSNIFYVILVSGLLGGYIISRYFLSGENILARRLDATLAVLFILPVAKFLYDYLIIENNLQFRNLKIFLVIFILSTAILSSYTLGPDTKTISSGEYEAMNFIWNREKNNDKICVLSDTYPLLVLEMISNRKIIGGGFPINAFFAQPEREFLLKKASSNMTTTLEQAKLLVGTSYCYLVGDYNFPNNLSHFGNIKVYKF